MRLGLFEDNAACLTLGTYGPWFWRRPFRVALSETSSHVHVIGLSGFGKSRFLAGLFLELIKQGQAVTLIDPHGDLSRLVLAHLVASGAYDDPAFRQRVAYLDLPTASRWGLYLPFNVLATPFDNHTRARNVLEAMKRSWPSLDYGAAPTFENIITAGTFVLASHGLPLPLLHDLLTDKGWRDRLLRTLPDEAVARFFTERYDRWGHQQSLMVESSLRRVFLLGFSPVLRYSLGQADNLFAFRDLMDEGRSLIINLALEDGDSRRLLGSLLTVGAEQAALSRAAVPAGQRGKPHHLIVDEFFEFSAQSGENLSRILSLTRKFGLSVVMAHQTLSQANERIRGALQNAALKVVFRLGRHDAEYLAPVIARADPLAVKHDVGSRDVPARTHPLFYSLTEQREAWIQEMSELPTQEAFVKRPTGSLARIRAAAVPDPKVDAERLAEVETYYLARYFRPQEEIERALAGLRGEKAPRVTRVRPLDSSKE